MANNISSFQGKSPIIHETAFIDVSARVIGEAILEEGVSIWPMAVLRADSSPVFIGKRSAVLDLCLIESPEGSPVRIGNGVLISHGAIIHGATISSDVLIGAGAIVLDDASIGEGSIIGTGSIVTPRTFIPSNSLVLGSPGRVIRETTAEERENIKKQINGLYHKSRTYIKEACLLK